jgi:hypothetical protein
MEYWVPSVGDGYFCVLSCSTVRHSNLGVPLVFGSPLLESLLVSCPKHFYLVLLDILVDLKSAKPHGCVSLFASDREANTKPIGLGPLPTAPLYKRGSPPGRPQRINL